MIAVDTNILVYAHRPEYDDLHTRALLVMDELANSRRPWAIPWPCLHEFVGNVTNSRIYKSPTPLPLALEAASVWACADKVHMLGEVEESHFMTFMEICIDAEVAGPRVHDARIAAICIDHGVTQFWTADRDFFRWRTRLPIHNPLKEAP